MLDAMIAVLVVGIVVVLAAVFELVVGLLFGKDVKEALDEMAKVTLAFGAVLLVAFDVLSIIYLVL